MSESLSAPRKRFPTVVQQRRDPNQGLVRFFKSKTLGAPENAVGFILWKLVHRFQREIDRELQALDLTHLQFTSLAMVGWLNRSGVPPTQAEISRHADIQAMQISQVLGVLEEKKLLTRAASPHNKRAKCVRLTRAGLSMLRRAMPIAISVQLRIFGEAGAPGGELLAALQSVYSRSLIEGVPD